MPTEDTTGLDKPKTTVEGENTPETQAEIDWEKIKVADIPNELLREHPLVVALSKRVGDREATIKKMREASEPVPDEKPETKGTETAPTDDLSKQLQQLNAKIDSVLQRDAANVKLTQVESAIKKFRLPNDADVIGLLNKMPDAEVEAEAARLAKLMKIPATETGGGNPGTTGNANDPIRQRILDRVKQAPKPFADDNSNPMSPGYQKMGS